MDDTQILRALAEGIDPVTGEVLGETHVCQYPPVIRALFRAAESMQREQIRPPLPAVAEPPLTVAEKLNYERLRKWRNEAALKENIAPFIIASNRQLMEMARLPVSTPRDLLRIKGFGQNRTAKYGIAIAAVFSGDQADHATAGRQEV
ncbi:MAG TPA: HRDC domain-containing protein [Fimbriimonadaceae bacterium]|nr:HRDC domain-containing protein [Fimbriimonadaceae bacterium]